MGEAGKRRKFGWRRLPGLAALLAALLLALTGGAPAVSSPCELETDGSAQTEAALLPGESVQTEVAPLPGGMTQAPLTELLPEEPPTQQEPEKKPFAPVAQSEPAAAGYFEDVLFLGDSRTEGLFLYGSLREATYLYAVGATVESVFTKPTQETSEGKVPLLDALAEQDCGKVYIMLGVNELGWSRSENFYEQYGKLIDRVRTDHPDAEVVLQSILPVSAKQEAKKSYVNNARIAVYNEIVRQLAQEKDCPYLDVAEVVTDADGCLKAELTEDGVHLNVEGCRVWQTYLETHTV